MDAMMAEEVYSVLYNGKNKTVHGTVISEEKKPHSDNNDNHHGHDEEDTFITKRKRRDAIYYE